MFVTRKNSDRTRCGFKKLSIKADRTAASDQKRSVYRKKAFHTANTATQQHLGKMKNLYLALLLALCLSVLVARAQDDTDDVSENVFALAV